VGKYGKSDDLASFNYNSINYNCPLNGGYQLNIGDTRNREARIWPRTGCDTIDGQFKCDTGDATSMFSCKNTNYIII